MSLTPSQRSMRARIAAHHRAAMYDGREMTAKARKAFADSFYDKTDPSLPHAERLRRAEHLRRAHYSRMALASAKARRRP
jgi:hypothetical protein